MMFLTFKNKNFSEIKELISGNTALEIRPDLNNISVNELKELLLINNRVLITTGADSEKYADYVHTALKYNAEFIDLPYNSGLLKGLERGLTKLIISHHNSLRTPYEFGLIEIIEKMREYNPHFYKIVTKANKKTDAMRVLQLHSFQPNLIAFTFGRNTEFSRFSSYYLGASVLYAAIDENSKTAPGQTTIEEAERIIEILG